MIYFCCEENRRAATRDHPFLNGIDYLEVVDQELIGTLNESLRQRVLRVFFLAKNATANPGAQQARKDLFDRLAALTPAQVRITGGERVRNIVVVGVELHSDTNATLNPGDRNELAEGDHLEVGVTERGDFSTYTLGLVLPNSDQPLTGLDPALSSVDFSFKVECPSPFDCRSDRTCTPPAEPVPEIDYLAKDYASFRQLILDRLAVLLPEWRERNPADLGITLVELLAYAGDYLSYRQDAIATEAYLGTARQRASVRRHASLLDYPMHDGCNARAWVQIRLKLNAPAGGIRLPRLLVRDSQGNWTAADSEPLAGGAVETRRTQFATRMNNGVLVVDGEFLRLVAQYGPEIFEPMHEVTLFSEHNELPFYTWSNANCCLPKGATKATLRGDFPNLQPGDVLVFQERLGPKTGDAADADLHHRHAVRLTQVNGKVLGPDGEVDTQHAVSNIDPVTQQAVTEIQWAVGDALPFALCVSSVTDSGEHQPDVSLALGNIVLADHGMTLPAPESLGAVPEPDPVLGPVSTQACDRCSDAAPALTPPRFRPPLQQAPLTQNATITRTQLVAGRRTRLAFDPAGTAASAFDWEMESVLPAIQLGDDRGVLWLPKRDLLSSDSFAPEFVVETANDGRSVLRFGDDENGLRPGEETAFFAVYRVGNGTVGNIGAEALYHASVFQLLDPATGKPVAPPPGGHSSIDWIASVTNPLAAAGGVEPETLEQVRQYAPAAFRVPKRAVTPEDYATMAENHPEIQRAAATLRWTGSWHTVFLAADRLGGRPVDDAFQQELAAYVEPFRMAGQDLEIDGPQYVPLEIEILVCVQANYFGSDVLAAMRDVFSSGVRADGSRGFFHPDNFTFGQGVYLSRIYAEAQKLAGVRHVEVTTFQRLGTPSVALETGVLAIGRLEIARLDNDPNFPDRGQLRFTMKGGR